MILISFEHLGKIRIFPKYGGCGSKIESAMPSDANIPALFHSRGNGISLNLFTIPAGIPREFRKSLNLNRLPSKAVTATLYFFKKQCI